MNEQALDALREAMEAPTWWTNRARLSPREIVDRLEEQGYTVAPLAATSSRPSGEPQIAQAQPESLWPEMMARAEQDAATEAGLTGGAWTATTATAAPVGSLWSAEPSTPAVAEAAPTVGQAAPPQTLAQPTEVPAQAAAEDAQNGAAPADAQNGAAPAEATPIQEEPRRRGLGGLMADLESRVTGARQERAEPTDEEQRRSA